MKIMSPVSFYLISLPVNLEGKNYLELLVCKALNSEGVKCVSFLK